MVGLLGEMGPVGVAKFGPGIPAPNPATAMDTPFVENQYAWTKKSAMLFVEQPGGTGFSTASKEWTGKKADERTEDDVASSFYAFLQNMYTVFGEDLAQKKLYLSGESYAGFYIPSIARGIYLRNKGRKDKRLYRINLSGVAIGNGWIDPVIQGEAAIDYAFWHGMIDLTTMVGLKERFQKCIDGLILDKHEKPFHPFTTPDECGTPAALIEAAGGIFQYDVTTFDAYPALLNDGGSVSVFFNDPAIRESLNAPSMNDIPHWSSCVPGSGRRRRLEEDIHQRQLIMLDHDQPLSMVPYIVELLDDAHIDVLMYNGDLDLACGSQGTELCLESMDWSNKEEWNSEQTKWKQWKVNGRPAGHTKALDNLTFLVVYNSGHFVPINQAKSALNMIGRFIDREPFGDKKLPMFPANKDREPGSQSLDVQADNTTTRTHGFSLLVGLCGFLLGILASHVVMKRRLASERRSSSSSVSLHATEVTPLNN